MLLDKQSITTMDINRCMKIIEIAKDLSDKHAESQGEVIPIKNILGVFFTNYKKVFHPSLGFTSNDVKNAYALLIDHESYNEKLAMLGKQITLDQYINMINPVS